MWPDRNADLSPARHGAGVSCYMRQTPLYRSNLSRELQCLVMFRCEAVVRTI